MVIGADLYPIRIQIKGVGPNGLSLHIFVMDIGDSFGVEIDEGGIAWFGGRGVGMAGKPEKDLGVGDQDGVESRRRLGDGAGAIDIAPKFGLGAGQGGMGDDDCRFITVEDELSAQPGQLAFGDAATEIGVIGGEKKHQIRADLARIIVVLKGEGPPESLKFFLANQPGCG